MPPGVSSLPPTNSLGVAIPGVVPPDMAEGEPAWAWMISSRGRGGRFAGFFSKSSDFESRIVRKLIASMPFDSAGMIWNQQEHTRQYPPSIDSLAASYSATIPN